jgi:hypothetical protein
MKTTAVMMEAVSSSQTSVSVYQTNITNYWTTFLTLTDCLLVLVISDGLFEQNNETSVSVDAENLFTVRITINRFRKWHHELAVQSNQSFG